jgi:hypothetical protein
LNRRELETLRKHSTRSWAAEIDGHAFLYGKNEDATVELPYRAYKNQIEKAENLLNYIEYSDKFRRKILEKQLIEAKIMFVFRYRWQFLERRILPFRNKWIHLFYRRLLSERFIREMTVD